MSGSAQNEQKKIELSNDDRDYMRTIEKQNEAVVRRLEERFGGSTLEFLKKLQRAPIAIAEEIAADPDTCSSGKKAHMLLEKYFAPIADWLDDLDKPKEDPAQAIDAQAPIAPPTDPQAPQPSADQGV